MAKSATLDPGAHALRYWMLGLMTGAQASASIVQQGLGSLAPFIVAAFALSKAQLGLLFMAMQIGSAFVTTPSGVLVDRFGERRVVLWSGAVMGGALVLAALLPIYAWFAAWMFVFGMAYAPTTPAGGRAILGWFQRDRGLAMGIRQTGVPAGGLLGAITLPLLATAFGYRWALVAGAAVTIGVSAGAAFWYRDPPSAGQAAVRATWHDLTLGALAIVRDPRAVFMTLACMPLVCAQGAMNAFVAITAVSNAHVSVHLAALVFGLGQGCALLGRLAWGIASDRIFGGDRVAPIFVISGLAGAASFGLARVADHTVILLFVAAALLGFTGAAWNGLFAAAMVEIGGAQRAGSALGVALTFIFLAGAAAPPVFGAIADTHSLAAAWDVLGWTALAAIVPAAFARAAMRRAAKEAA